MPNIRPFRALHYDSRVAGDLAALIAPPYDVIDQAHLDRLYARNPCNVVRLILNREADRYQAAAAEFAAWREQGILAQDSVRCLYFYVQDFRLSDGSGHRREGLIAAVHLEPFSAGKIRPHERTFSRAKEDRLRLVQACRANLSPLFGVYANQTEALEPARAQAATEAPWIDVTDEFGERHRVWRLVASGTIGHIVNTLRETTVFIADGHHRYETALAYRDQMRTAGQTDPEAPHNFVLMYLTSMDDAGLVILPTHRILRRWPAAEMAGRLIGIEEHFAMQSFPATAAGQREAMACLNAEAARGCLALRATNPDRMLVLRLRDPGVLDRVLAECHPAVRYLDVTVLDAFVLRRLLGLECTSAAQEGILAYTHDEEQALAAVSRDGSAAAFLLRPPKIGEVEAACLADQTMPEKSTYFYPKLLSGLVFHSLVGEP